MRLASRSVRTIRFLAPLLAGLLLAACTSSAELKAQDQKTCEGQGNKPGSDEFAKCMLTLTQNRDKERDQDMNAVQRQQQIMMSTSCPAGMCW
jgi:hypothetical protein